MDELQPNHTQTDPAERRMKELIDQWEAAGEYRIKKIVAVWTDDQDTYILSPCGHCRQFMLQVHKDNIETEVILDRDRVVKLADLLPYPDWFHKIT